METLTPLAATSLAMSTMGIRWPGDMKGKKNKWSSVSFAIGDRVRFVWELCSITRPNLPATNIDCLNVN